MLIFLSVVVGLVAFGAHAVMPFRLANGPGPAQYRWRLLAPLLFSAAVWAGLARFWRQVDTLAAAEIGPGGSRELLGLAVLAALLAVLWADLLLLLGRKGVQPAGWRLAAVIGIGGLGAVSLSTEILLRSPLEVMPAGSLFSAVLCRILLALASGELLAPARPVLAPIGALGLAIYPFTLPEGVRFPLLQGETLFPMAAAALLFVLAPWVPARLRRGAIAGAIALAALALAALPELISAVPPAPIQPLTPDLVFPR